MIVVEIVVGREELIRVDMVIESDRKLGATVVPHGNGTDWSRAERLNVKLIEGCGCRIEAVLRNHVGRKNRSIRRAGGNRTSAQCGHCLLTGLSRGAARSAIG